MKIYITVILLILGLVSQAQNFSNLEVRNMYFDGWEGQCGALDLVKRFNDANIINDALILAYLGAATTTLANCKKFPTSKLSVFFEGKRMLEDAIEMDPENVEIRFIRYTIQTNIPGILNYDDMESDKKMLMEYLRAKQKTSTDVDLSQRIIEYLIEHGDLTNEEQSELNLINNKQLKTKQITFIKRLI